MGAKEIILQNCTDAELNFISNLRAWMIRNGVTIFREGGNYFSFRNSGVENSNDEIFLSIQDLAEVIGYNNIKMD
jgi:hypothetical protein